MNRNGGFKFIVRHSTDSGFGPLRCLKNEIFSAVRRAHEAGCPTEEISVEVEKVTRELQAATACLEVVDAVDVDLVNKGIVDGGGRGQAPPFESYRNTPHSQACSGQGLPPHQGHFWPEALSSNAAPAFQHNAHHHQPPAPLLSNC